MNVVDALRRERISDAWRRELAGVFALFAVAIIASCASQSAPPVEPSVLADEVVVAPVEPWTFEGVQGFVIRTPHYRIFTTEPDATMRHRLTLMVEAALEQYTMHFALLPYPETRLDTFLMGRRWEWERLTQRLLGAEAPFYLRIQRGGYAAGGRGVFYNIGLRDTLAIAAHEGWHQYTQRTFLEPLPVWLEEGIACYMEGFRTDGQGRPVMMPWANIERFDELRDAWSRGGLLALPDLLNATPQGLLDESAVRTLTYYAQVWALVHFLREHDGGRYRAGLERMLLDASRGRLRAAVTASQGSAAARSASMRRTGPAAFQTYFGRDLDETASQYADFIEAVVRTGSKDTIVRGESPLTSSR